MFTRPIDTHLDLAFLHPTHARELFKLFKSNHRHLSNWLVWPSKCRELADFERFVHSALIDYAQGAATHCAIRQHGDIIGCIALSAVKDDLKKADLSYWISKEFQGQGIMSKVCLDFLQLGFEQYNLEKIEASVATQNIRSRKIHEKLGFELEGILKRAATVNDTVVDHARYGLLYGDYRRLIQRLHTL
ncbi:MAG: GNAT family N-acetyltransferase [Pseudomonadales bacterium]